MLVTLFGTFILSIAEQPENALPLIVVILFGIDKPTSSLHPKNILSGILFIFFDNVTFWSAAHPLKIPIPRLVTLSGITIPSSDVHSLNA